MITRVAERGRLPGCVEAPGREDGAWPGIKAGDQLGFVRFVRSDHEGQDVVDDRRYQIVIRQRAQGVGRETR